MVKLLGIDEAGRGPVMGSMFIAGVLIDERKEEELREMGVKDSKVLSEKNRENLALKIRNFADKIIVKEIRAKEIDEMMKFLNLNEIEMQNFARIIEESDLSKEDIVYIDLPERDGEKFIFKLRKFLPEELRDVKIIAENKADSKFPVVSAASIIAKSERERHIKELYNKYTAFLRTGYSHDNNTIEFLENYIRKYGKLPEDARKSWETSKKLVEKYAQKKLREFNL